MARSQPLLFARNRYGPRETYKHKMDAVNILRGFTNQVLDNTNIQFELLSNLLHKELYDSFDCLRWPPRSSRVAGQYYTIIDQGGIGYEVIFTREYQY